MSQMTKAFFAILLAAAAMRAETLPSNQIVMPVPSANQILVVQEREARERHYADRAAMAAPAAPPAARPQTPGVLSRQERRELQQALDRLFREHPGVTIDARTGKPIDTIR